MDDKTAPAPQRARRQRGRRPADVSQETSPIVLRWLERTDIFNSGIPNRDVTEADALAEDLLELAVESGTHERIG